MRILIGDDSLTHRVMLEAIVRRWGYEAVLAEDGQQAWELLSAPEAPRLVLLDWEMPGLDGLEVCRRVRARQDQDPPYILLLTARQETADIVAGLDAGANDYISKPFENTELHARLRVGARMLDLQRELISAREALEFQANHDALTGLMNRGAVMRAMEQAMQAAGQGGQIRSASSTSIISNRSTIATAIPRATRCCRPCPAESSRCCVPETWSGATAERSSCCW
jgi:PleD family two-component response regulator